MTRPRKFIDGGRLGPLDAVHEIMMGRYVLVNGKPQHPSWMGSMHLRDVYLGAQRGIIRRAAINPLYSERTTQ